MSTLGYPVCVPEEVGDLSVRGSLSGVVNRDEPARANANPSRRRILVPGVSVVVGRRSV